MVSVSAACACNGLNKEASVVYHRILGKEGNDVLDQIESSHSIADWREESISIRSEGYSATFVHHATQIRKLGRSAR